jgi:4-hydroxybutyrate dehydrogenase
MSLIAYVSKIHFAENVLEDALEAELDLLGISRPMVVCDHVHTRTDIIERLTAALPLNNDVTLYDLRKAVATADDCSDAADLYDLSDADGLIAFGGIAAMNLVKAIGVRVSHKGDLQRYAGAGGSTQIADRLPPIIAIPTTANACAEVMGAATLGGAGGRSMILASQYLMPRVVVCDPTLTLDLSPREMASAGMDALTHCVETFIASAYNPPADGIARDGIRRAVTNLERAVSEETDLTARRELMAAALNGALASQKGLGGVHAMSHALGALGNARSDHGTINGVLLPHVLDFNAPAAHARYIEVRQDFGIRQNADLADAVVRLRERIGLPSGLSQLGFDAAQMERTAALAADNYFNRTNPRHAGAGDYKSMLLTAL